MVRRDVAARKITRASAWLDDADVIVSRPLKEFVADARERDLATFYIFLAVQECVDLAAHWVADAGWPPPDDAASTFDVLAERAVVDREHADRLRAAVGLRNRIAHGYGSVDHHRLHSEARLGIRDLRRFLLAVAKATGLGD